MAEEKTSRAVHVLPSFTDAAILLPVVFLFVKLGGAKGLLSDGDTGWHIRAGEWMIANGRVPRQDMFSFSKPGEPWFAWEWLWDVIFAWLHSNWGMAAVVIATLVVLSLTFAVLYRMARSRSGNVLLAISFTLLAIGGSAIHWHARPHMFTLLFVVISFWILELARDGRTRLLWVLPPLTILWTNLHGGFIALLAMILTYAAGEGAAWLMTPDKSLKPGSVRRMKALLAAAAGCTAASFINPYFHNLHVHIYTYLTERYHHEHVSEFLSLDFHHPLAVYFEVMLAAAVVTALWSVYRRRYAQALLLVSWAHLAIVTARNIPIFLIIAAPLAAQAAAEWLELAPQANVAAWVRTAVSRFRDYAAEVGEIDRPWRLHLTSVAVFAVLVLLMVSPAASDELRANYDPKQYPEKALEHITASDRVFTIDDWGDYLIYRRFPEVKVFIDGRSDFYGPKFGKEFLSVLAGAHDWETKLRKHRLDTVLLPVKESLASTLKQSPNWHVEYDDGTAILFRSNRERGAATEMTRVSAVQNGGCSRDRVITSLKQHSDPTVTKSNARR